MKCVGKLIGHGVPVCHKESIIRVSDEKAEQAVQKKGYVYVTKKEWKESGRKYA